MFKFFRTFVFLIFFLNLDSKAENIPQKPLANINNKFLTEGRNEAALYFQKPASPIMHEILHTHNIVMIVMSVIFILCCALLIYIIFRFSEKNNPNPQKFTHNTTLEIFWTVIPILIVCVFAFYNLKTLYHEEIQNSSDLTIKVVGHQWYWTYEYPEEKIKFDSYMKKDEDLIDGDKRLLSVDNAVYVPVGKNIKILVTADDVIHSWALPAFGVKKDCVPGRINETWFKAEKEGVFYGQCSELCGILHGFMPIEIHVVSDEQFAEWKKTAQSKFAI